MISATAEERQALQQQCQANNLSESLARYDGKKGT